VIIQGVQDLGEYAASLIAVGNNEHGEYIGHFNEWMDLAKKHCKFSFH
jgi:hypothetical protein